MDKEEKSRLKAFIEKHIPFYELKEVGYWPKGTRRTDYEKIAERICLHFGFKTIYEYSRGLEFEVDEAGVLHFPAAVHLTVVPTGFECPICTCVNEGSDHAHRAVKAKYGSIIIKCNGCKRKLRYSICILGINEPVIKEIKTNK